MEHEEDEDEEEEDVDFNPLLKGSPSLEASSSLSSEVEGLDADLSDSGCEKSQLLAFSQNSDTIGNGVGTSNFQEQILVQSAVSSGEQSGPKLPDPNGRKSDLISESENGVVLEKECGSSSGADVTNDFPEENTNTVKFRMLGKPLDDEDDAICKRTRARYSLANFTLDELEAFLQETDDDDDLPNVDEEEEYKKFLAAVLQDGGEDADQVIVDSGNDEDEDSDADFELEIEEALESDDDDYLVNSSKKGSTSTVRRPETRQNKRQKFSVDGKDKVLQSVNKPLRPLVPVFSSGMIAPLPSYNGQYSVLENACNLPSLSHSCPVNVFTPNQIGQLYYLVHEHVQLLIQVYSLSVLEPSRKNIASQIQGLLSEMLHKREQALTWRKIPHSSFCFHPPHNHPSFLEGPPSWPHPQENTSGSSQSIDGQSDVPATYSDRQRSTDPQTCISSHKHPMKELVSSIQAVQSCCWFPFVGGPVLSVLDVAPLKLVGKYMDDVSTAVNEQMRWYVESTGDLHPEKKPLFPLPSCPSDVEANVELTKGTTCSEHGGVISSSSNHKPKKTLAATLVESTKKQSVALVPEKITELARQFYPLFNPALFPHKPPLLAIANRVLFTDSEDELLAMGLLEYNTDWKAIQQRFLPCKSKHQIFVRQKNRCSSKAPENPIKAVRRLKTSPLTGEEKARIFEGIKTYKLDWMSIWKLIVPYRDPSLLPRQWRIAIGTQKSYKVDPSKREKRRIYEWKRRQNKRLVPDADDANGAIGQQNEHEEEDCTEKDNEVRAHEFLFSDCRQLQPVPPTAICEPSTPNCNSEMLPQASSNCNSELLPQALVPGESNVERQGSRGIYEPSPVRDNHYCDPFPQNNVLSRSCNTSRTSQMETMPSSKMATKSLRYEPVPRPYRARRPRSYQMVRLAPELPPVNLPPSVRVISQAAFKNLHRLPSGMEKSVTPSCVGNSASDSTNVNPQKESCSANQENSCEPEMGMHSVRSHNPENSRIPCLTLSSCDKVVPHQINLSPLPQRPQQVGSGSCMTFLSDLKKSTPCGLKFRQPIDNINDGFVAACQASQMGVNQCERSGDAVPCNGPINELDSGINLHSALRKEKDSTPTGTEVILPRDDGHGCLMTGAGDQSVPEIVMEQEELSDSDEEIEHVEFECEEMADSEGEEEL